MRLNGEWLECEDVVIRPSVSGLARQDDGQWVEVAFLLDAGADRTVKRSGDLSLAGVVELLVVVKRMHISTHRERRIRAIGSP
jgi:hypothetical protein